MKWSVLLNEARVGLAAAPDPSVESALRRAAQRFFREAHVWKHRMEPITLEANTMEYPVEVPAGTRVERVVAAKLGGTSCDVGLMRYEDIFLLGFEKGAVQAVALTPLSDQIALWRVPDENNAGQALELLVSLAPTMQAREIPDALADEWHDGIVAGARAEMFANKDMPWFDPGMATYAENQYAEVVARARREEHSGHHVNLRVRPRPFI